jgi:hypothetical protein
VTANSRIGSLANMRHKAGGGEKKIFDDKEYSRWGFTRKPIK